jgi:O-methyltransferase domain/Dimerisation domain
MADSGELPWATLRRLVNGYQATQAIHVAAVLGLADLLAGGPRDAGDLAAATATHPASLARLARALAALGVLADAGDGRYALTPLGDCLRTDARDPLGDWAAFVGRRPHWQAWGHLEHSVRTGETAFPALHGSDVWTFRAEQPEEGAAFDGAMTAIARRATGAVLEAYDFSDFGVVVDVGGGAGAFLAAVLAAEPTLRGVLVDRPGVVAGAPALLARAGVAERCEIVVASFFERVPAGGDAYVLKSILHDWEDPEATAILRTLRAAIPAHGVVLVIERDLDAPGAAVDATLSDLNMLVNTGGRERTRAEYEALLGAGGFALRRIVPVGGGLHVVEAASA